MIEKDADRTFCDIPEYSKGSMMYSNIIDVCHAVSVYKPQITYVQGMNFIVGSLLTIFSPEEAFWMFLYLIKDYKLMEMYTENMPLLQLFAYQLRTLLEIHLPKINTWFIENSLDLDIFCPQWFLTLFSKNDNTELFFRVIDLLFITGTKALFQVALSLLGYLYKNGHLDDYNFDPKLSKDTINTLIDQACNYKVSNRLLKELEKKSTLVLRKNKCMKENTDTANTEPVQGIHQASLKTFSLKNQNFIQQNLGDSSLNYHEQSEVADRDMLDLDLEIL